MYVGKYAVTVTMVAQKKGTVNGTVLENKKARLSAKNTVKLTLAYL